MEHHAIPLTDAGRRQADALALALPEAPSQVLSSPFVRARDTARPYEARTGVRVEVLDELREFETIDPELLVGMTGAERRPLVEVYWQEADPRRRYGRRAESFHDFAERVEAFWRDGMNSLPDRTVVFGHGMWISMLAWQLIGFSASDSEAMRSFRRFQTGLPMPNGAVYRFVRVREGRWAFEADEAVMRHMQSLAH